MRITLSGFGRAGRRAVVAATAVAVLASGGTAVAFAADGPGTAVTQAGEEPAREVTIAPDGSYEVALTPQEVEAVTKAAENGELPSGASGLAALSKSWRHKFSHDTSVKINKYGKAGAKGAIAAYCMTSVAGGPTWLRVIGGAACSAIAYYIVKHLPGPPAKGKCYEVSLKVGWKGWLPPKPTFSPGVHTVSC